MAGSVLILLVLSLLTSPPDSIPYVGPEEVILFSQGSGQNQVGLILGDKPQGPARLLAANSKLYLLDQLNSRVLCFDTSGSFLSEIKLKYQPLDMAVDGSDRVYVLDTSSASIHLESFRKGDTSSRVEIILRKKQRVTGVVVYPSDILYIDCGDFFSKPLPQKGLFWFLKDSSAQKIFLLNEKRSLRNLDIDMYWDGYREGGHVEETEIYRLSRASIPFLSNKDSTRIIVGSINTDYKADSSTFNTTIERGIFVVVVDKKATPLLYGLPDEYFYINNNWRNVSVDFSGNVYMFVAYPDGKAAILKWRPSL
jgi:hypothetical protein